MIVILYLLIGYFITNNLIIYSMHYKNKENSVYDKYRFIEIFIVVILFALLWPLQLIILMIDLITGKTLKGM